MKVRVNQAVKMFFGNSSMEMIYFEAIANALDANANKISIDITANAYNQANSLQVVIEDNGEGFTNERYNKFCNLFDVEENSHKGLGRLVYLCYFDKVSVSSYYGNTFQREFAFTDSFDENDFTVTKVKNTASGTKLKMTGYILSKLKQYSFVQPIPLKNRILEEFYARLYLLKQEGKKVEISISATIENISASEIISTDEMPVLEMVELEVPVSIFDKFYLHYSIVDSPIDASIICAISIDNRTHKIEIIATENIPIGYKMIFLLYSDWFTGKIDLGRQNITISESEMQLIQQLFRKRVASIVAEHIPYILERNQKTKKILIDRFPHLNGYFNVEDFGFVSQNDILKKAQERFFRAQREILGANSLSDEQYKEALELSSRALTEYILFRQITIEKLKKIDKFNCEADIHNLICPKYQKFDKENLLDDIYRNNAWLLDDKYMTYNTVLSDKDMLNVVSIITEGEYVEKDEGQPDIALIFSNNPNENKLVDVVIVELKKKGIKLEENMKVVTQLEKRARRLMQFYNNKIQRIWFYGIVEFNDELELALTGEYKELYSTGKVYYRETKVAIQKNPDIILPVGVFIMDLESVVNDANARNSTFLDLIKSKFKQ